jgi:DNA-binding response OmpR family regulator
MTRMILQQNGYTVLEAADGREAVAVAEEYLGPIDLLLTDLMLPRLSGRDVAERLTAVRPGLRVLYMSGYPEDVLLQQGVQPGADNYLHKPFSLAGLVRKVREVLGAPG